MSPLDVVGLGQTVMDRIVRVSDLPGAGMHSEVLSEVERGGGMTANVMVAFARLGLRAGLIAAVGADDMGARIRRDLDAEGVDTRGMVMRDGARSPHWLLFSDSQGRRAALLFNRETMQGLRPDEVQEGLLDEARVYFTDVYAPAAAVHAARLASARGIQVACDMQANLETYEAYGNSEQLIREVLERTDIFLPSVGGLTSLAREHDARAAMRHMLERYPRMTIALTLGAEGSLVGAEDRIHTIPAFQVEVVDTLGAGDAYHAAFVYGRVFCGWSAAQAGRFASAAGALKCTRAGARSAPRLVEIQQFLAANAG